MLTGVKPLAPVISHSVLPPLSSLGDPHLTDLSLNSPAKIFSPSVVDKIQTSPVSYLYRNMFSEMLLLGVAGGCLAQIYAEASNEPVASRWLKLQ